VPFGVGFPELIILLLVLLLVFGAKRLPEMGRSLGKGMREFKDGVSGVDTDVMGSEASPPAELPSTTLPSTTQPNAAKVAQELQSLSEEDKKAIVDALRSSEQPSAPESERETVS
jgi:sec-independent protein translocase protein TatA